MRNVVIVCIVLFTMAGTAFSETKEPARRLAVDLGGGVKMEIQARHPGLACLPGSGGEVKQASGAGAQPERRRGPSRSRASTAVANEPASQGVPQVQGEASSKCRDQ
jgi:hypothetical protein